MSTGNLAAEGPTRNQRPTCNCHYCNFTPHAHMHMRTHTHTRTHAHTHTHAHSLAATCLPPHTYTTVAVYIDRLTMPKLMICTGGDEFFQPDDSIFYWDQLKEPKFIR